MIVVNLFGAPGAGKSTGAAYIFSKLKMAGVKCELVTEFAKDMVWEENQTVLDNQVKILGEQYLRMTRLKDNVDVIITDSPLLNSGFYNSDTTIEPEFSALVSKLYNKFENLNFYIMRVRPYVEKGRLQTEQESDQIGLDIVKMLEKSNIQYNCVQGDEKYYDSIANAILEEYFQM